MPHPAIDLPLHRVATTVPVSPGEMITISGSLYSAHDGSILDGASTTWPEAAPGGASVDAGGLIDFAGSGFAIVSRDADSHTVTAVATGKDAPRCAEHGVDAPCLLLRTKQLAHGRLLTVEQYVGTLQGGLRVEGAVPAAGGQLGTATGLASQDTGSVWAATGVLLAAVAAILATITWWRRWSTSLRRQLTVQIRKLRAKIRRLDPVLAAVLVPELGRVSQAVRRGQLDPASVEGRRVATALKQLEADLDTADQAERSRQESATADALMQQLQSAVVAAMEAGGEGARTMIRSTNP